MPFLAEILQDSSCDDDTVIMDETERKKRKGLRLLNSGKSITVSKAADDVKLANSTLHDLHIKASQGEFVRFKPGRPSMLDESAQSKLKDKVTSKSLALQAPKVKVELRKLVIEQWEEVAPNQYLSLNESHERTIRRYVKNLELVVKEAEVKTGDRIKGYTNIRSSLSFAAGLKSLFQVVPPELYVSFDDLAVLVNDYNKKPEVITTKEAMKWLKEHNIAIATTGAAPKRRVITFNVGIAGRGLIVCRVIKFCDHLFTDMVERPKIYDMGDNLYYMLHHTSTNDETVQNYMYEYCHVPAVLALKDKLIAEASKDLNDIAAQESSPLFAIFGTQPLDVSSSPMIPFDIANIENKCEDAAEHNVDDEENEDNDANPANEKPVVYDWQTPFSTADCFKVHNQNTGSTVYEHAKTPAERFQSMAVAQDGALGQIKALLAIVEQINKVISAAEEDDSNTQLNEQKEKLKHLLFFKYSAACSMTQSPNDKGRMHAIFKQCIRRLQYEDTIPVPNLPIWTQLGSVLHKALKDDRQSFTAVWKCLVHAPAFLNKAFTEMNILSAYQSAGIIPYNSKVILSHNPHFRSLSQEAADFVLGAIDPLSDSFTQHGMVSEEYFSEVLSGFPGVDNSPVRTGKSLNDMATNRQRALMINHPNWLAILAQRLPGASKQGSKQAVGGSASVGADKKGQVDGDSTAAGKKRKRATKCCSPLCSAIKGDGDQWSKCKGGAKNCRKEFCNSDACQKMFQDHKAMCKRL